MKTRLASDIGDEAAFLIYKKLLTHTLSVCQNIKQLEIRYCFAERIMPELSNNSCTLQYGNDLGDRMANAFANAFEDGFEHVCCIGSDLPEMNEAILLSAFEKLETQDLILGRAFDGGYYLIGMNSLKRELFEGINWSTNQVLKQTVVKAKELNLRTFILPELRDIDTIEDLHCFPDYLDLVKDNDRESGNS